MLCHRYSCGPTVYDHAHLGHAWYDYKHSYLVYKRTAKCVCVFKCLTHFLSQLLCQVWYTAEDFVQAVWHHCHPCNGHHWHRWQNHQKKLGGKMTRVFLLNAVLFISLKRCLLRKCVLPCFVGKCFPDCHSQNVWGWIQEGYVVIKGVWFGHNWCLFQGLTDVLLRRY